MILSWLRYITCHRFKPLLDFQGKHAHNLSSQRVAPMTLKLRVNRSWKHLPLSNNLWAYFSSSVISLARNKLKVLARKLRCIFQKSLLMLILPSCYRIYYLCSQDFLWELSIFFHPSGFLHLADFTLNRMA